MSRVLITGAGGFTGRYLAQALHEAGHEVHAMVALAPAEPMAGVTAWHQADLTEPKQLSQVLQAVRPDKVAHLAAISFVAHGDAEAIYRTNVVGTRHLLQALADSRAPLDAVLLASSANVYGNATEGVLTEEAPLAPANDYAVSKLAMEHVARLYADRLPLVVVRPFNYTGVGQAAHFLIPKIVGHVQRREAFIELGNLNVARDFSDVRTVVACYLRLLQTPAALGHTFNVCSGQAHTLAQVLALAQGLAGHSMEARVNPAFVRTHEVKTLTGSRARLDAVIGQVPNIELADTLRWMLDAVP